MRNFFDQICLIIVILLQLTPCEAFLKEAKFAINLRLKKKPVGPQDESGSRRSSMSSEAQTDEHMFS